MPYLRRQRKRVSQEETQALIDALENPRDKAMITFLWITGCRISEALEVVSTDIFVRDNTVEITIPVKKRREYYRHTLPVSITTPFINYLLDWHKVVGNGKLFDMTRQNAHHLIHKINNNIWPHVFRHNRMNSLLDQGADVMDIKLWAGWKEIETASSYLEESPSRLDKFKDKIR